MTDYYIVAPTSGMYAERLGNSAALAGLIIGLNSVAALASTILYSYWMDVLFLQASLGVCHDVSMGRMFGVCQCPTPAILDLCHCWTIDRRLWIGTIHLSTVHCRYLSPGRSYSGITAGFVTVGALGTSAGPALASLLYLVVPPQQKDSENLYWQVENAPGWTMSALWLLYIICVVFYFQEPERPRPRTKKRVTALSTHGTGVETEASETQSLLVDDNSDDHAAAAAAAADGGRSSGGGVAADKTTNGVIVHDDSPPLWRIVPVVTTFLVYFTLKFFLESLLSSTAILTEYYFDWGGNTSGIYLAILGLLVLPANWLVSEASQRYDDRDLILVTAVLLLLECLVILPWWQQSSSSSSSSSEEEDSALEDSNNNNYSVRHYVLGSVMIFVSANALEGPNMSLLSTRRFHLDIDMVCSMSEYWPPKLVLLVVPWAMSF
jgi:hypothetical protein